MSENRTHALYDAELSFKAKGILFYLGGCSSNEERTIEYISKISKDSTTSVKSGLNELIKLGYFKRVRNNFDYDYYFSFYKGTFLENEVKQ